MSLSISVPNFTELLLFFVYRVYKTIFLKRSLLTKLLDNHPHRSKQRPASRKLYPMTKLRRRKNETAAGSASESDSESEDDDVRELEGRTMSAKGQQIDRASAANVKRSKEEAKADPEEEDDFGYTMSEFSFD
ncbi:unnamed protein product [Acanthoscelides obtectus]|uniref:Uncharacterized protein n=1 Tax=Acanthoscelides obtectus TaxID=200917 RepID=A0A9P0Q377_ACAOB|nr:unnamed protein product [Acanthoscelides obtectus]CAK1621419.1 Inactivation-no-after-potential D protein [Acanthoscelides obtectus]